MVPDLEKLRRFALGIGLILIAYAVAGVDLDAGAKASVLGMPFIIRRPELLPASLMLASAYGLIRFYYYGFMLRHSPQWYRKDALFKLHAEEPGSRGRYNGSVFFGPEVYSTTPLTSERKTIENQLNEIIGTFPKALNLRVQGKVKPFEFIDEDGEERISYEAIVTIPFACRAVAFFQDLDYAAPVWLNFVALVLATAKIVVTSYDLWR